MNEQPLLKYPPDPERLESEYKQRLARAESEAVALMAKDGASLAEIAENAAWFAEASTQKNRHPASPPVACKSGCTHCCHQAVSVTAAEAARIAQLIAANAGSRDATLARLAALDAKTRGLTPLERARLRAPCAFLEDGACQVYEARPLACAEFTSYDVENCKREQVNGFLQGGVIHEKARLLSYQAVYEGLRLGLAGAYPAADAANLELTAAVRAFLENPELEKQWAAGTADLRAAHFKEQP